MIDPFERGKVWFLYRKLEREFIETTSYVALETIHENVWSEKFGELLIRMGSSVGSFFNLMINSKSLDKEKTVTKLRDTIKEKRQKKSDWSPTITYFRKAFNSVFQLSSVDVEASYGLTNYGKLKPFRDFERKAPSWWEAHNKLKHEFYQKLEERAILRNAINALVGLFILNILHKESQRYLIWHTNVIDFPHQPKSEIERHLMKSMIGKPKGFGNWKVSAVTPLFMHHFRLDENMDAGDIYDFDEEITN